jgi:hypothetical protein
VNWLGATLELVTTLEVVATLELVATRDEVVATLDELLVDGLLLLTTTLDEDTDVP